MPRQTHRYTRRSSALWAPPLPSCFLVSFSCLHLAPRDRDDEATRTKRDRAGVRACSLSSLLSSLRHGWTIADKSHLTPFSRTRAASENQTKIVYARTARRARIIDPRKGERGGAFSTGCPLADATSCAAPDVPCENARWRSCVELEPRLSYHRENLLPSRHPFHFSRSIPLPAISYMLFLSLSLKSIFLRTIPSGKATVQSAALAQLASDERCDASFAFVDIVVAAGPGAAIS